MQVEIKSAHFAHPVLVHPDVPDGVATSFVMCFRPEFRDGELVALHFDDYQYCFMGRLRTPRGDTVYAACSRAMARERADAIGDEDPGAVWDAWPFPPEHDLSVAEIALKSLADEPALGWVESDLGAFVTAEEHKALKARVEALEGFLNFP